MSTEQELTESSFDKPIVADNPPTLFILILPLTWLSFSAARATWLVVNLAMLLGATWMLLQLYSSSNKRAFLIFGLFSVLFPQILVGILAGQVSYLVLLGLAGSLLLVRQGMWFWAGASLILTTVKPHMIVLAVPYLLLYMAYRRKWQGWLGFFAAGGACLLILPAFRASWPSDLMGRIASAPVRYWANPTVGGLMSWLQLGESGRYIFAVFFPLVWLLARRQSEVMPEFGASLLTLITVPTTFFWLELRSMSPLDPRGRDHELALETARGQGQGHRHRLPIGYDPSQLGSANRWNERSVLSLDPPLHGDSVCRPSMGDTQQVRPPPERREFGSAPFRSTRLLMA